MESNSRTHRLIGAVVLLSLAVIFVPMLFNQRDIPLNTLEGSNIPRPPENVESIIFELNQQGAFEQVNPESSDSLNKSKESLVEVIEPVEVEPVAEQETAKVKPVAGPTFTPVSPAPNQTQTSPDVPSWMVQIGSFSNKNNAVALRDRLRKANFSSYLDERKASQGSVWRVRVGPILDKGEASQIKLRLEKESGLKALIIKRD